MLRIKNIISTICAITLVMSGNFYYVAKVSAADFAGGDGTVSSPYQIDSCARLQLVSTLGVEDPDIYFVLTQDIDCSATSISNPSDPKYDNSLYNSGAGFSPIGSSSAPFQGSFDGDGHTISNLYINRSATANIGLFGYIDSTNGEVTIEKLSMTGVSIIGNTATGGIVGNALGDSSNWLNISEVSFSGNVTGAVGSVGGLVGTANYVLIISSSAQGAISGANGTFYIGGLVGALSNAGATGFYIVRSHFVGDISVALEGSGNGGLIGITKCSGGSVCQVDWSYADIDMDVSGDHNGGLIGAVTGNISTNIYQSYSTGSITISTPGDDSGGIVGETLLTSGNLNISNSYSEVNINGGGSANVRRIGGLVGHSSGAGSAIVRNCYSKGSLNGGSSIGGLYGTLANALSSFNSYSVNSVSGSSNTGGFAGEVTASGSFSNNWWFNATSGYDANFVNDAGTNYPDTEVSKATTATDFHVTTHQVYNQDEDKWNFTTIWLARDNNYPILQWQQSDNEEETDTTPPTFSDLPNQDTVINITEGQIISTNPFVIQVRPIDANGISKAEFYIDNNLICVDTIADANGVYDCGWNTAKYHSQVKIYAYDTSNNKSEALIRNSTVDPKLYLTELPATGIKNN